MALPQYKLHREAQAFVRGAFPVILAPADPPQKLERLRNALCSRKLLTALVMLSVVAGAALLWLLLDPALKAPKPALWLLPAGTLAACLLLFMIIAMARQGALVAEVEDELPPPWLERVSVKAPAPQVKMHCEQWSSAPFTEIIDDAVIAEVFNDEMVAPDHMVFSLKVEE